ncbi:hypothetical protein ACK3Z9_04980 [Aeromonas caviae]|uniref:hypothetical protein n=1 Tax=Vibrio cholerae TaxID=666 RepID=UPI00291C4229|nr:hypothetical protein [Vibrio cholerae]
MSVWHDALEIGLLPLEETGLDCDGMTYVISHLLRKGGIPHRSYIGYVKDEKHGDLVVPHCWVKLEGDGDWVIDLRLRTWLGDDDEVPHGVFQLAGWSRFTYRGQSMAGIDLDEEAVEAMTDGKLSHVKVHR